MCFKLKFVPDTASALPTVDIGAFTTPINVASSAITQKRHRALRTLIHHPLGIFPYWILNSLTTSVVTTILGMNVFIVGIRAFQLESLLI